MAKVHDHAMRGERERRRRGSEEIWKGKKKECKEWNKRRVRRCEAEGDNSGQRNEKRGEKTLI